MATITVTTILDAVADDGELSLREALTLAQQTAEADRITFDQSVFAAGSGATILLQAGELQISGGRSAVTIDGDQDDDGRPDVTIDAGGKSRIGTVSGNGGVTIDGLVMTGGFVADISDEFSREADGGALYVAAPLTVMNSLFRGNRSEETGGAVYGIATFIDTQFIDNGSKVGGAIYTNSGRLNIAGSSFIGNRAKTGGAIHAAYGGGIVISDSLFQDNSAGAGGAIWVYDKFVTIDGSSFIANHAETGDGGGFQAQFGLVYAYISNSTFSGNVAAGKGGALQSGGLNLTNSTVVDNQAGTGAGGISGSVALNNSIVAGNRGDDAAHDLAGEIASNGANLVSQANVAGLESSDIVIDPDDLFDLVLEPLSTGGGFLPSHAPLPGSPARDAGSNADAIDQAGRLLVTDQRGAPRIAGGVVDIGAVEGDVTVNQLVVTTALDLIDAADGVTSLREALNAAASLPGDARITFDAALLAPGAAAGRTIDLEQGQLTIGSDIRSLTIDGDLDDDGKADIIIDAGGRSRIFEIDGSGPVVLDGLQLTGGHADGSAAGSFAGQGGAVLANGGHTTFVNAVLAENQADGSGGAVALIGGHHRFVATILHGNEGHSGGALHIAGGTVEIEVVTFTGNRALQVGGAIEATEASKLFVATSLFKQNVAEQNGGALWISDGELLVERSTFAVNSAAHGDGGGLFLQNTATYLSNSTLSGNVAVGFGGGMVRRSIDGNYGPAYHGVRISNSTIVDNVAGSEGGGMAAHPDGAGIALVANSIVAGNGSGLGDSPDVFGAIDSYQNLVSQAPVPGRFDLLVEADEVFTSVIGPLAENGGPTPTHALLPDSPAINAGQLIFGFDPVDQTGAPRVAFGERDLGSVEFQGELPATGVDDAASAYLRSPTMIDVLGNDRHPASGPTLVDGPRHGVALLLDDGRFTYMADDGFKGAEASPMPSGASPAVRQLPRSMSW